MWVGSSLLYVNKLVVPSYVELQISIFFWCGFFLFLFFFYSSCALVKVEAVPVTNALFRFRPVNTFVSKFNWNLSFNYCRLLCEYSSLISETSF